MAVRQSPLESLVNMSDFLVIGAGVVGIAIARELAVRHPKASIVVLEKEHALGGHASGRNSGVIHAGFYYTADSLKARFTRDGNAALTAFCTERGLRIKKCGKLIVAKNETELPVLEKLLERGRQNGVKLQPMTELEAKTIEPRVKTFDTALFSPTTASIDPLEVLCALAEDAQRLGANFHFHQRYLHRTENGISTNNGEHRARYIINTAGLYADKIAKDFGFSKNHYLLPFKGLYLYATSSAPPLLTNVYPVPNLGNPFLGVHFTVTVDGKVKIGPTAIPALWREQYGWFKNFNLQEFSEIISRELSLFTNSNFNFRELALEELYKQFRPHIVKLAGELVHGVRLEHFKTWGNPGIRAQLVNAQTRNLEMDFRIEHDDHSLHVLNAVSPAFTCCIPFAKHIVDIIAEAMD